MYFFENVDVNRIPVKCAILFLLEVIYLKKRKKIVLKF